MKIFSRGSSFFIFFLCISSVFSSDTLSPAGRWITIDDKTARPKSVVTIVMKGDTLIATIDSLFLDPGDSTDPVCDKCTGWRKGRKVKGLTITDAMVKHGNEWSGGSVVDPKNGKTYRCIIKILDSGKKLVVRGYIGISLIGRSQVWDRVR